MAAIRIYRRLQDLQDVDPNGLPQSGVPRYHTDVSSFVVETIAGGAGGSFSLGASTGGNTLGATGVTGTRVVLAGVGNLTLSQSTDGNGGTISISGGTAGAGGVAISASNSLFSSGTVVLSGAGGGATVNTVAPGTIQISVAAPVAQTVQTQNRFNLTLAGNTAGALQEVSSGTLTLAGGNGITLSQAGNGITVSGSTFSQSVQPETQTFIGGVAASNTTYTSGTVSIVGSGIVTVQSGTGQRVIINASQSVQAETQTFVGGIAASNTTYTSGTISLTGVGGGVTVSSNTGQRVDISVAAQTGTQFSAGLTNSGNTSGDTGTVGGRLLLVGTNNITLSGSTNGQSMTVTLSGPSVAGAQTGISGFANSETTYTSGTVKVSELGAVTFRSTTGQQFQISVAAQTAESQSIGMSNLGNTSGTTGIASGAQVRMLFAGGNNVTLSQSLNGASGTITISAFNQTVQTQNLVDVTISGNTSGAGALISSGTLTLAGGNNITLSQAGNAITISGANVGGAQTGISGIANSQTTYTSGTVTFSELGAITIRSTTGNQFQFSVNSQTVQTQGILNVALSNIGNTSGDTGINSGTRYVLAGGNGITLSGSSAANATTVTISGITQSVESQSIGMSNLGNTSGTTGIASGGQVRFLFAGGNNITLSQSLNGASGTITVSAFNQTGTQFSAGISGGNTSGDTGTVAGRVVLAGGNNITLSGSTNGVSETITISAFTQSVESQSIGMSNIGNTSGTTGMASGGQVRFAFAGGNNITLSQSLNGASGTITISAPNLGAGAMSVGVSNLGNTAGSTGVTGTRLVLVGTNNVTLSQSTDANGGTVSISAGGGGFSAGVSTGGNTAGATGISGTQLVLVGTNQISLSQTTGANGATVTIDAPVTSSIVGASGVSISTSGSTISVLPVANVQFNPFPNAMAVTGQQGNASLHIQPISVPHLQFDRMLLSYQFSNASNSSNSFTLSHWVGIYTKNASTLSLVSSISTSTNFSGSGTAGSYSLYGGMRQMSMPWTMTLSSGDYWVGIVTRSTTGGGAGHTLNQMLKSHFTAATLTGWSGLMGAATNATVQQQVGLGTYSVSTAGIPSTIGFSEITGSGSLPLFVPLFQFRSGTV